MKSYGLWLAGWAYSCPAAGTSSLNSRNVGDAAAFVGWLWRQSLLPEALGFVTLALSVVAIRRLSAAPGAGVVAQLGVAGAAALAFYEVCRIS
jgi:hypothetical protein